MAVTSRGPVTAATNAPRKAEDAPVPAPKPRKAAGTGGSRLAGLARFVVTNSDRGRNIPVTFHPRIDADDPTYQALATAARQTLYGDHWVRFRNGRFDTTNAEIIAWLRHGIAKGRIKNVREDEGMRDAVCPTCGETYKVAEMGKHILSHQTEDTHVH